MINQQPLETWLLETISGRHILSLEKLFYHNNTQRIFGYNALQLGFNNINYLHGNKISNKYIINKDIKCNLFFLPFETNSIDLIICPHILEYIPNYHLILQECYRVLTPCGSLVISSFNKKSIFKPLFKINKIFNELNFVNLELLKTQLHTLNFRISSGSFLSYTPPLNNNNFLTKLNVLDKIGNRWLPTLANIFTLTATKDTIPLDFISPTVKSYTKELTPQLGILKICNKTHYQPIITK